MMTKLAHLWPWKAPKHTIAYLILPLVLIGACSDGSYENTAHTHTVTETTAIDGSEASKTLNTRPSLSEIDQEISKQAALIEKSIADAKATSGKGAPLMWSYADDDTTVYLLGSFHMLPADSIWQTPEMLAAFQGSDTLILESDVLSAKGISSQMKAITTYGTYTDGRTLSNVLGTTLSERTDTTLRAGFGLPLSTMDNLKPWFAGLSMAQLLIAQLDFDPDAGVDRYFGERLGARDFLPLESADEVFKAMNAIPEATQIENFVLNVETLELSSPALEALVDEWIDGDEAGLQALLVDAMESSESIYEILLIKRNKAWLPKLLKLLDAPGEKFVVVGAAHLIGEDSVVKLLRDQGIVVTAFVQTPLASVQ